MYKLKVECHNASELAANQDGDDGFAMIRRAGFGASDSSILLDVNPFPDGKIEKLLAQKRSSEITDNEKRIGELVSVRKGRDLEPVILQKFEDTFNVTVNKPKPMYRIVDTPLLINFDGIMHMKGVGALPVEIKLVTIYGRKYYDFSKSTDNLLNNINELSDLGDEANTIYITKRAKETGIPVYYYTQIQQQMMGINAPWGYLAVMDDKEWELKTFVVMADPKVQKKLLENAQLYWSRI